MLLRLLLKKPLAAGTARRLQHTQSVPLSGHSLLTNKTLISVQGPDATKFLNGLVTYKMLPTFVKKNEMTISTEENDECLAIDDFDLKSLNWGSLRESVETKNLTINRNGIFTSILNSKGRIISDVFIYPYEYLSKGNLNQDPHYLVEINTSLAKILLGLLKIHKLKAKVSFKVMDDLKLWYAYNDSKQELTYQLQTTYFDEESQVLKNPQNALLNTQNFVQDDRLFTKNLNKDLIKGFAFDDRCPDFGIKLITPSSVENLNEILNENFLPGSNQLAISVLDTRRFIAGIAESPTELTPNKYLPLESCFEYMGGINFDKGCYTGQELTVRTYHTGIVRKRIVPVKLYQYDKDQNEIELDFTDDFEGQLKDLETVEIFSNKSDDQSNKKQLSPSPFGNSDRSTSRRSTKRSASGTLLKSKGTLGLALVRLEDFANEDEFFLELKKSNDEILKIGVKAFIPYWWPAE